MTELEIIDIGRGIMNKLRKALFSTTAGNCTILFGVASIVAFLATTNLFGNLHLCLAVSAICFMFLTSLVWILHFLTEGG